ncbi:MAG: NMD3-related protein [Candidatus Hodarchaeales archaeon]
MPVRDNKCVNCGAEGASFQNLCQNCYLNDHPIVLRRGRFKIPKCRECGNVYYNGSWSHAGIDPDRQLLQGIKDRIIKSYKFSTNRNLKIKIIKARLEGLETGQDKVVGQLLITWKADPLLPDIEIIEDFEGRLKWRGCTECRIKEEVKFSAKIQFRFSRRYNIEDEQERFINTVPKIISEEVNYQFRKARGGFDVILDSKSAAKAITLVYQHDHGAEIKSSIEIYGYDRYLCRQITRDIHLVRYSELLPGDIVDISGKLFQILSFKHNAFHYYDYAHRRSRKTDRSLLSRAILVITSEDFHTFQKIDSNARDNSLEVMDLSSSDFITYSLNLSDFPGVERKETFKAAIHGNKVLFDYLGEKT